MKLPSVILGHTQRVFLNHACWHLARSPAGESIRRRIEPHLPQFRRQMGKQFLDFLGFGYEIRVVRG